jgi:hypothetical protein
LNLKCDILVSKFAFKFNLYRYIEGQLADSLLEQDGQLAFSNLAASTVATLMPKIETGGQLGKARWRVTTAPSIPGLLSLDPSTDPFRNISQFTLGSDWWGCTG